MRISPNTQVHSISWQHPNVLREEGVSSALYYELLNYHTGRPRDRRDWLRMRNMLLIIDEAQGSYQYDNLWTQFIKRISQDGDQSRWIILFSSYGSPAATPTTRGPVGSPPIQLSADQRVSVRSLSVNNQEVSLYFTCSEFYDVVTRVCKQAGKRGQPFRPSPELLEHIWEFSNGHPGGTRILLDALINSKVSVCSFRYHLYV